MSNIFKGYKIRVRCINWEQKSILEEYWNIFSKEYKLQQLVGLGFNWSQDNKYFDYAIGTINDTKTLNKLKNIDFSNTNFNVEYLEKELPNLNEWKTFKGTNLKEIYDNQIDCNNQNYDYELEYFDEENIEIKIHYIN